MIGGSAIISGSGLCNRRRRGPKAESTPQVKDKTATPPHPRVLEAVANPEISARIEPLVARAGAETLRVGDGGAFALAARRSFDLVIAQCPLAGMGASKILECLRIPPAGTATTPVVLLTREAYLPTIERIPAEHLEDTTITTALSDGLRAIAKALDLSDRASAKLMVQVEMVVESARFQRLCQTRDISPSGMLLHTRRLLPVGSVLPFSLDLPEETEPIHGNGEIVRHARPEREPTPAMGVRFLGLHGDGPARLESFISSCRAGVVSA